MQKRTEASLRWKNKNRNRPRGKWKKGKKRGKCERPIAVGLWKEEKKNGGDEVATEAIGGSQREHTLKQAPQSKTRGGSQGWVKTRKKPNWARGL